MQKSIYRDFLKYIWAEIYSNKVMTPNILLMLLSVSERRKQMREKERDENGIS